MKYGNQKQLLNMYCDLIRSWLEHNTEMATYFVFNLSFLNVSFELPVKINNYILSHLNLKSLICTSSDILQSPENTLPVASLKPEKANYIPAFLFSLCLVLLFTPVYSTRTWMQSTYLTFSTDDRTFFIFGLYAFNCIQVF